MRAQVSTTYGVRGLGELLGRDELGRYVEVRGGRVAENDGAERLRAAAEQVLPERAIGRLAVHTVAVVIDTRLLWSGMSARTTGGEKRRRALCSNEPKTWCCGGQGRPGR